MVGRRGRRACRRRRSQGLSRRSTSTASAPNFPAIQDIKKHVVDKGKSQTAADKFGENLYNRGVYNSVLIAEAIRNAQKITGKKVVTGEDVRRGFETLNITAARWKELGLRGLRRPDRSVSCATITATMPPTCSNGTAPSG